MKGIILAGGSGTRLYPLTKTISKQLLPVYDKPMIYYPLSTLMLFGIRDILILSTPHDLPNIEELLGDGKKLGINLQYKVQAEPKGIAQAFTIGADFIGDDPVCLILGDNIFYMENPYAVMTDFVNPTIKDKASIFAYHVPDPERFGVVEFGENHEVLSLEEKPSHPKSHFASVGLYFYPNDVIKKTLDLKPSKRGELEITDLNNTYLKENRLQVIPMRRGSAWMDAGTPDSLMDASEYIQIIEKRQGLKLGCIEEIAYNRGFIRHEELKCLCDKMSNCTYREYLANLMV